MFLPGRTGRKRGNMSNTILVLADATEINMEFNSNVHGIIVKSATKEAMVATWKKLTNDNLKFVQFKTDGVVSAEYVDLVLVDEKSIVQTDGSIITEFHLREKTDIEKLRELVASQSAEIAALKEGQGVQDGAIEDLGAVTSTLAEKVEGGTQ